MFSSFLTSYDALLFVTIDLRFQFRFRLFFPLVCYLPAKARNRAARPIPPLLIQRSMDGGGSVFPAGERHERPPLYIILRDKRQAEGGLS